MKKKRVMVLHAQVPFIRGGAELLVESLVEQLKNHGFETELVALPYKWYPDNAVLDSALAWRMVDITESDGQKVDLVIPTKFPTYVAEHSNKVLWLVHQFREAYDLFGNAEYVGYDDAYKGIQSKVVEIDNKTIGECREVFTISQNVSNRLMQYNNIPSAPLYHPPRHYGKYYCSKYENYVLSVGRLTQKKRLNYLLKALAHCDSSVKAYFAGVGPDMEILQRTAEEMGLSDRVKFFGAVSDEELLKLYANAFAVYFAPLDEDYGYVSLEALLSKKPLVTCADSGGVLEFAKDKVNSLVCQYDPASIGSAINDLYNHKDLCKEFGQAGYEQVKDINWDVVIDQLTKSIR